MKNSPLPSLSQMVPSYVPPSPNNFGDKNVPSILRVVFRANGTEARPTLEPSGDPPMDRQRRHGPQRAGGGPSASSTSLCRTENEVSPNGVKVGEDGARLSTTMSSIFTLYTSHLGCLEQRLLNFIP